MKTEIVTVGPELAKEFLELNINNRNVSKSRVDRYARDMMAGRWNLTHQGIAFDADGYLLDGQHRLMAILESGASIKMLVTWGGERVGVDELRPRSAHDVIKFGGLSDWMGKREIETGKSMRALFICGAQMDVASTAEVFEFCEKNKKAIQFVCARFASHKARLSTAVVRAVFAVASYHYSQDKLSAMIASLYSGVVSTDSEMAAIKLRDFIMSGGVGGGISPRLSAAKKISRTIEAYCKDKALLTLQEQKRFCFDLPIDRR